MNRTEFVEGLISDVLGEMLEVDFDRPKRVKDAIIFGNLLISDLVDEFRKQLEELIEENWA